LASADVGSLPVVLDVAALRPGCWVSGRNDRVMGLVRRGEFPCPVLRDRPSGSGAGGRGWLALAGA